MVFTTGIHNSRRTYKFFDIRLVILVFFINVLLHKVI
jgi:hypothetical protein